MLAAASDCGRETLCKENHLKAVGYGDISSGPGGPLSFWMCGRRGWGGAAMGSPSPHPLPMASAAGREKLWGWMDTGSIG